MAFQSVGDHTVGAEVNPGEVRKEKMTYYLRCMRHRRREFELTESR